MKRMAINAELSNNENLTNHSARKTMLQKLNDNNIPPNQIMQISGHKNIQSINNYSSLNSRQLQEISTIMSNDSTGSNSKEISYSQSLSLAAQSCTVPGIFSNATISGSSIAININSNEQPPVPAKRKRYVIESSDSSQE